MSVACHSERTRPAVLAEIPDSKASIGDSGSVRKATARSARWAPLGPCWQQQTQQGPSRCNLHCKPSPACIVRLLA